MATRKLPRVTRGEFTDSHLEVDQQYNRTHAR